ncbi:hypothetical protein ELH92_18960 [Rhizobium ruizarguesonis]|nr:hypothetical protein ELH92_18960 [Rhizobium ruizarguesonis]
MDWRVATRGIYEMVRWLPDAAMMVELLNSPEGLLKTCLVSKKLVALCRQGRGSAGAAFQNVRRRGHSISLPAGARR